MKPSWFSRPGIASIFRPRDGIVHEWITSAAVTRSRTSSCIGTTIRLSTSRSRNSPGVNSDVGVMYESNSTFGKSEYSYLQYHWCPIVLIVREGFASSSLRYRSRSDGRARNSRVIAGRTVHTVSTSCASMVNREVYLFTSSVVRAYPTVVITRVRITRAWSWNEIICSIIGEAASWSRSCDQYCILSELRLVQHRPN